MWRGTFLWMLSLYIVKKCSSHFFSWSSSATASTRSSSSWWAAPSWLCRKSTETTSSGTCTMLCRATLQTTSQRPSGNRAFMSHDIACVYCLFLAHWILKLFRWSETGKWRLPLNYNKCLQAERTWALYDDQGLCCVVTLRLHNPILLSKTPIS